jgi:hypothetical protein
MKRVLIPIALLIVACGRSTVPGAPTDYRAPDGSFSARLPSDWKVDDAPGETRKAAFFGPPSGVKPFSQLMGVYFHPSTEPASARAYLASEAPAEVPFAPRDVPVGGGTGLELIVSRTVPDVHFGPQRVTTRLVEVVVPGGFYSLEHTWPTGTEPSPSFDELLHSFKTSSVTATK